MMRPLAAFSAVVILVAGCTPKPIFRADPDPPAPSDHPDTPDIPAESSPTAGPSGDGAAGGPAEPRATPTPVYRVEEVASTWFGVPYRYGGADERGIDCSGLVQNVFGDLGTRLPRTTRAQSGRGREIPLSDVRAGDLLFFRLGSPLIDHVGIALGPDRFVHSSSSRGVVVDRLMDDYFARRIVQARRVLGPE